MRVNERSGISIVVQAGCPLPAEQVIMQDPKKKQHIGKCNAFSLFPDLMRKVDKYVRSNKNRVIPPPHPDVSWLNKGLFENEDDLSDVAAALVLMPGGEATTSVRQTLEKSGYHVEQTETVIDALRRLASNTYRVVVLHTGFETGAWPLESEIHDYLSKMSMTRRRRIYYILLGPEFQTLYDLEALSLSANLVVNDADLEYLPAIFRKGFQDYINLFGPLLEYVEAAR